MIILNVFIHTENRNIPFRWRSTRNDKEGELCRLCKKKVRVHDRCDGYSATSWENDGDAESEESQKAIRNDIWESTFVRISMAVLL